MTDIASHIPTKLAIILLDIVEKFQTKKFVEPVILTGSYARGDFTKYGDVNMIVFYEKMDSKENSSYDLNYIDNYISVHLNPR